MNDWMSATGPYPTGHPSAAVATVVAVAFAAFAAFAALASGFENYTFVRNKMGRRKAARRVQTRDGLHQSEDSIRFANTG